MIAAGMLEGTPSLNWASRNLGSASKADLCPAKNSPLRAADTGGTSGDNPSLAIIHDALAAILQTFVTVPVAGSLRQLYEVDRSSLDLNNKYLVFFHFLSECKRIRQNISHSLRGIYRSPLRHAACANITKTSILQLKTGSLSTSCR